MNVLVETPEELLARARADRLRPGYHFVAPAGWLNDPNGVAQRNGIHHLFYQYNPYGAEHRRIHWGHATSTDLVHWTDRPIALRPDDAGPDQDGCWSGVLVDDGARPVLVYSGNRDGRQSACLAYGDAGMDTWVKEPGNPVIAAPPTGSDVTEFRDHCVWRENGAWRQLISGGLRGLGGCVFLYESDDLISWRELGTLAVGSANDFPPNHPLWTGTTWECGDFFRFTRDGTTAPPDGRSGDPHVLLFSAWHEGRTMHPIAAVGRYRGDRFEIERYQRLDLGGRHAYAPQTYIDGTGRRVLWAWMQEGRSDQEQRAAGWSGAMALPRRLWLDVGGVVRQEPVAEVTMLRAEPLSFVEEGAVVRAAGKQAELELRAELPAGASVHVELFASPDGSERTVLELRARSGGDVDVVLDRSRSSRNDGCDLTPLAGVVTNSTGVIQVRAFLDRSSVEVFIDGIALTARVYPADADATGIRFEPRDGAVVHSVAGWTLHGAEEQERRTQPMQNSMTER